MQNITPLCSDISNDAHCSERIFSTFKAILYGDSTNDLVSKTVAWLHETVKQFEIDEIAQFQTRLLDDSSVDVTLYANSDKVTKSRQHRRVMRHLKIHFINEVSAHFSPFAMSGVQVLS